MNYDFGKIQGPRQSKRENFEELICQLLAAEMKAEAIDGAGGDNGIDCYIKISDGSLTIFQAKYFLTRLTSSQRKQIKHSLETAFHHHRVSRWILCIPIDKTPSESEWFDSLAKDDVSPEWWGETEIRILFAKHPEIARAFFAEDSLISEFNKFRQEILETLRALKGTYKADNLNKDANSVAYEYLERASKIGNLLLQDAPLLQQQENTYIGLDFSEIYYYISSNARYITSTPVIDYCIQNSPQSLYIPPGAVLEMHKFLERIVHQAHYNFNNHLEYLKHNDNPLQNFINAFEQDSNSEVARQAYQSAIKYLRSMDIPQSYNLSKLRHALDSGLLNPTPADIQDITYDKDKTQSIFRCFEKYVPRHAGIVHRLVDARNLQFLKQYMDVTGGVARMISSDRLMGRVSLEFFGKVSFVRESSEYAYLVHSSKRRKLESSGSSFESEVKELIRGTTRLRQALNSFDLQADLINLDNKYLKNLSNTFRSFAPSYRTILRPVDEMIESGLTALPKHFVQSMEELYARLKSESDLVASFKNWWDCMCQELLAIEEILQQRYLTGKIMNESKLLKN